MRGTMSPKNGPDQEYARRLGVLLFAIQRKTIKANIKQVVGEDLRPGQAMLLVELSQKGPKTMGDIANRTKIHPAVATRFLDRLVDKGLVERTRDEEDRRIVRVSITDAGARLAEQIIAAYTDRLSTALAGASQKDRDTLLKTLQTVDDSFAEQE
jgi:DNA-binding MarR family transcriptional regulator